MPSNAAPLVRGLTSTGDWTFGSGLSNYLTGNAAVVQQIRCRLLQFKGECFFDAGAGIDWFGFLGGKNQLALNLAINGVILNTPYVTLLNQTSAVLNRTTRNFSVNYNATTTFSTISSSAQYTIPI